MYKKRDNFIWFCLYLYPDFKVLITNCENINDELLEKEKELDLLIKGREILKCINLNDRIKYICLGFLTEIIIDNENNFIYISRLKNNNLNSPILNLTNHKLIGINIKNNEKSYSNIGLFIYYPLKEFIDKTYYKRMSVKEFASKYE